MSSTTNIIEKDSNDPDESEGFNVLEVVQLRQNDDLLREKEEILGVVRRHDQGRENEKQRQQDLARGIRHGRPRPTSGNPRHQQDHRHPTSIANQEEKRGEAAEDDELDMLKIVRARAQAPEAPSEIPTRKEGLSDSQAISAASAQAVEFQPGAYSGAPGTNLERTEDLRFSLVGRPIIHENNNNNEATMDVAMDPVMEGSSSDGDADAEEGVVPTAADPTAVEDGLIVANKVSVTSEKQDLPEAETMDADYYHTLSEIEEKEQTHHKKVQLLLGILLVLIVGGVLLYMFGVKESGQEENPISLDNHTNGTNDNLGLPPAEQLEMHVRSLLPANTLEDAGITDSPQYAALNWTLSDPYLGNYSDARIIQRFALATVWFSTGGQKWFRQEHWLSYHHDECQWEGITCVGGGETDILEVEVSNESGEVLWDMISSGTAWSQDGNFLDYHFIPGENLSLSLENNEDELSMVRILILDENRLSGPLPGEIYLLTNLVQMDLTSNYVQETSMSSEIGQLSNLRFFFLTRSGVTGTIPTEVGLCTSLEILVGVACGFVGPIPSEIGNLNNLFTMVLDTNDLTGSIPTEIGNLEELEMLYLQDNQLSGGIPTQLGKLSNMLMLELQYNPRILGPIPSQIGSMTNLFQLVVVGNSMSSFLPTELALLTNLFIFEAERNMLTGSIPSQYGLMSNMHGMTVSHNSLTGTIPSQLGLLSNIQFFDASNNSLTSSIPRECGFLSSLLHLELSNNQLTGPLLEGPWWKQILQFFANSNQLTGTITTEVGLAAGLRTLHLQNNKLSGFIPSEIGLCSSLTELQIENNDRMEGTLPNELENLAANESLNSLSFQNTSIVGRLRDGFCSMEESGYLGYICSPSSGPCGCSCKCVGGRKTPFG